MVPATETVALAVPPTLAAGVVALMLMPATAALLMASETTVPSGSVAVTVRLPAAPCRTVSGPVPQSAVTGSLPGSGIVMPSMTSPGFGAPMVFVEFDTQV